MKNSRDSQNNFDLIRLFAALEVVLEHTLLTFDGESVWTRMLNILPGVPIFFFVSGFLIVQSWRNVAARQPRQFFVNRALRIYPALYVNLVLTVVMLIATGFVSRHDISLELWSTWLLAHGSLLQFANPEFLRGFGTGAINPSLWSISVELQFYLLTPVVSWWIAKGSVVRAAGLVLLAGLNILNYGNTHATAVSQLFQVSFAPWLFMFAVGAYFAHDGVLRERIAQLRLVALLVVYGLVCLLCAWAGLKFGNSMSPVLFCVLAAVVFKVAVSAPRLSDRLLRGNDISYGIYIYHLPLINLFLYQGWQRFAAAIPAVAIILGWLSWRLIEEPMLARKRITLRTVTSR